MVDVSVALPVGEKELAGFLLKLSALEQDVDDAGRCASLRLSAGKAVRVHTPAERHVRGGVGVGVRVDAREHRSVALGHRTRVGVDIANLWVGDELLYADSKESGLKLEDAKPHVSVARVAGQRYRLGACECRARNETYEREQVAYRENEREKRCAHATADVT